MRISDWSSDVCSSDLVTGNAVRLTNADWDIDGDAVAAAFGLAGVRLVNDFAAVARCLPLLGAAEMVPIGGWEPEPRGACVAIGPGTGLGVAGLVPAGRRGDRKSTRLNSRHHCASCLPSSVWNKKYN